MDNNNLTVITVTPAILPVLNTVSDKSNQEKNALMIILILIVVGNYNSMDNNNLTSTVFF